MKKMATGLTGGAWAGLSLIYDMVVNVRWGSINIDSAEGQVQNLLLNYLSKLIYYN